MARRAIDTTAWSKNWKSGMDSAGPAYARGIMATDVDPMELAAQAGELAKRNFIASIDSGKFAKGLRRVGKANWQQLASVKGSARLSQGATEALPKFNATIAQLAPQMDQLRATISQMANGTPPEREARMLAWSRGMTLIGQNRA